MSVYPVLLVHGIDDTNTRCRQMRAALLARGFSPVYAMDIIPSDASVSIEAMGIQVLDAVRKLQQTTPAQKVDVVAYSMGALAVRYFLQRQGGRSMVRRFISIAGPHHGTLTAYLCQNVGCFQIRPGSDLLHDLNADIDPWGDVKVSSFWSPLDLMVIPATSSLLVRAHNRAFKVVLHPWMVSDKRVIEAVAQTLAMPC
ncbi:MAG: hypothetical protein MUO64_10380 [Anaerolineales bacterium]|nr:hypothetical protein [Anaerolineales bacterium]